MLVMREGAGNPGVNHDGSAGYFKRCFYLNTSANTVWICIDATVGAAVWILLG